MKGKKSRQVSNKKKPIMPTIEIKPQRNQNLEEIFKVNSNDKIVKKTKVFIDPQVNFSNFNIYNLN